MSIWSRIVNALMPARVTREIDEELQSHLAEAAEQGRDSIEVRRAFGSPLRQREASRDFRLLPWLDSLRADAIFGCRQLAKRKITSATAILSLALAVGACTSAFRLIDALLLRPLPIADPQRLYIISWEGSGIDGKPAAFDSCSYPLFRQMRAASRDEAELIAISYAERADLTYGSGQDTEKAYLQYVSGWMFPSFALRPVLGRLFTERDDIKPGGHPYAVLSYDYWTRRFGRDAAVIGRRFQMAGVPYEIVGIAPRGFTGTEPGSMTDIFVPTMMQTGSIDRANAFWLRVFMRPKPGAALEPLRDKLNALYRAAEQERAKGFTNFPKRLLEGFPRVHLVVRPGAAGVSGMQSEYRRALAAFAVLVGMVLLIACANVSNLMTAQGTARVRELALRVSIGAGRGRLAQLVLMESALLAFIAAGAGALFAWWSAPFVIARINPPDNPARLDLPADWRVLAFGLLLTVAVTLLFGFVPALRAASVEPASALKGAEDSRQRRRFIHALIAAQTAFCFLVLFVAGLFAATFAHLSHKATGFSADRVLALETVSKSAQSPVFWEQIAGQLRATPGVEAATVAAWPLLSGTISNNFISINGAPPNDVLAFFLAVSPGWVSTMKIPFAGGRDFRSEDRHPGPAIVNRTFARRFFDGQDPVGKSFETADGSGSRTRFQIVGLVGDAQYRNIREPMLPQVYVPFLAVNQKGEWQPKSSGTFLVRTSAGNSLALASILRQVVSQARPGFRVTNIRSQREIDDAQTVRERLLAMLALFFAAVALLLAGIGLYGVLDYSVLQRRREIAIRLAIGAPAADIARRVTGDVFTMVLAGAAVGLALGMVTVRFIAALLYETKATAPAALVLPSLTIVAVALFAATPALIRALRIDPAATLRTDT